ncbi:MAG: hypothetical protein JWL77_4664, partial [Chthonomonadaceae bacterium]|nr:hypothetical protein [Chthonomonadaceae bacterium]
MIPVNVGEDDADLFGRHLLKGQSDRAENQRGGLRHVGRFRASLSPVVAARKGQFAGERLNG